MLIVISGEITKYDFKIIYNIVKKRKLEFYARKYLFNPKRRHECKKMEQNGHDIQKANSKMADTDTIFSVITLM